MKKRLYSIWHNMKSRCYYTHAEKYKYYGGRGITVCDEWRDDFNAFYNWAINNGYKDDLTLDRIDSNGNYEPKNCRWATIAEQNNNSKKNNYIAYNGETKTAAQWAREYGIEPHLFNTRIRRGWSFERACKKGDKIWL